MPEVRSSAGTIELTWPAQRVAVLVSRIHSGKDGGVSAEVSFRRIREDGTQGHIEICSLNLLSSPTKASLAKKLDGLCNLEPVGAQWAVLIEQTVVIALKSAREGDPLQLLSTKAEATRPSYLLEPLLQRGQHTVVFGLGGTGKSYLAMMLGITVAMPYPDNHLGLWPGTAPNPVLYLDWETNYDALQWRLHKITRGMGLPDVQLHYRRCALPLALDIEAIANAVLKTQAKLVIVDSLGPACDGDLNRPEVALELFRSLRLLGNDVSTLIIAHTAKNQNGDNRAEKTIYGSAFFTNAARKVYELRSDPEAGEDNIEVAVFDRKSNDEARAKPWGLTIEFGDETVAFRRKEVATMGMLAENLSLPQRITHLLKSHGKLTPDFMAEEFDMEKDKLWVPLKRLVDRGAVVKLGNEYALAAT